MCMEDIRLMRKTGMAATQVTAPNGSSGVMVNPDPQRVSLAFGTIGATAVSVAPEGVEPSATTGFHLGQGEGMPVFDIQHHGRMVTAGWKCFGIAGAGSILVIETFLEKD